VDAKPLTAIKNLVYALPGSLLCAAGFRTAFGALLKLVDRYRDETTDKYLRCY
jgi:hypothetical protein